MPEEEGKVGRNQELFDHGSGQKKTKTANFKASGLILFRLISVS